jgi:predicted RecA/RadA family phage recombinase
MDNYVAPGEVLEYTAPTGGVVAGSGYLVGSLFVVATETKAQTLKFSGIAEGVVDLPKVEAEGWFENEKLYWDTSPAGLTNVSSGNVLVGVAVIPPESGNLVTITSTALAADLLIDGMTIQVLDYATLAGGTPPTVTVTVNGVATVLTEGTEWTAATSDEATAADLATAIDALAGVTADSGVTDTVTVTLVLFEGLTTGRVRLDGAAR